MGSRVLFYVVVDEGPVAELAGERLSAVRNVEMSCQNVIVLETFAALVASSFSHLYPLLYNLLPSSMTLVSIKTS